MIKLGAIALIWTFGFNAAFAAPQKYEKETGAPLSYRLPSIQATIRVQDFTAGNLQQISVVHDLKN